MNQFDERAPHSKKLIEKKPGPIALIIGILFLGAAIIVLASGIWKNDVEFLSDVAQILPQSELARMAIFGFCLVTFFFLTKSGLDASPNHPDFPSSWGNEKESPNNAKDDKPSI